jgi:D-alanine transaminase
MEVHMKTNLILINNDIVDAEEINVHPFNRGHQFGDGVYEIIPVYNGKALHAEAHMENLFNAIVQIRIPGFYMVDEMVEFTNRLIEAAEITDGLLYTQVTRGIGPYELDFPGQCEPELIMQAVPLDRAALAEMRQTGVNLLTVPDERAVKCDLNTLYRLPEILARNKARVGKFYDALFVRDEKITEATESTFMVVKDEMLWTYPMKLGSIHDNGMRRLIKEKLAPALDMQVIEKAFTKDFALNADEALLCGCRCEIMPVAKIDRRVIGDGKPGKFTLQLQDVFEDYIREQTK